MSLDNEAFQCVTLISFIMLSVILPLVIVSTVVAPSGGGARRRQLLLLILSVVKKGDFISSLMEGIISREYQRGEVSLYR